MFPDRIRRAGLQVNTYLPVLLMATLALGSWWLLRNAPSQQMDAMTQSAQRMEPDYFMHTFSVQAYNSAGKLEHLLEAKQMAHLPASNTFELTFPEFLSFNESGNRLTGHANKGTTNADGSVIELFEDAVVERQASEATPALQFKGPHLRIFANDKKVQSDQFVRLSRGSTVFTGSALTYDHRAGQAILSGRINAHMPASGS